MAGHLELLTPAIEVDAGDTVEAVVRVRNDGAGIEAFELEVTGEAGAWARLEHRVVDVPAGEERDVGISFEVPRGMLGGTGAFGYGVRLSWSGSLQGATASGLLEVLGHADVYAALRPPTVRGTRRGGAFVEVRNDGSAPSRVSLRGAGEGVDVEVDRDSLVVDAGHADALRVRITARQRPKMFSARALEYGVTVQPDRGRAIALDGTFRQRALTITLIPVLVLVLLAGGLVGALARSPDDDGTNVGAGASTTAPPPATSAPATTESPTTTAAPTTTAVAAAVPVPPENRRIAFQSIRDGNFEIYTVDAEGAGLVNITNHPAHDAEPAWSPDGHRIAFDSDRDGGPGQFDIYMMNADGTGVVRITDTPGPDGYPSWSPDGTRLAFISFRDGNSEIYVMPLDGSEPPRRLTRHPGDDVHPAWSPDGETIVFSSNRTGDYELWSMRATDGTGLTRLTDAPGPDMNPAWSPDGTRLAFDSNRDGDREIYTSRADGTETVRVTEAPGPDVWPAWSSDGTALAFVSSREGDEEIYVVEVDPTTGEAAGSPRRRTTSPGTDSEPAW